MVRVEVNFLKRHPFLSRQSRAVQLLESLTTKMHTFSSNIRLIRPHADLPMMSPPYAVA